MFSGIIGALGRHARLIVVGAVVATCVGAAASIGWITAPIA